MNYKSRSRARKFALQALYQWHFNPCDAQSLIDQFRLQHIAATMEVDWALFTLLVRGVVEKSNELDTQLTPLVERTLESLDPIALMLLRLGAYELQYELATPGRVVIKDAVLLSKSFGGQDAHKLVNAVLDGYGKNMPLRASEFTAP